MGKENNDDQNSAWANALERMTAPESGDSSRSHEPGTPESPISPPEPVAPPKAVGSKPRVRPAVPELSHVEPHNPLSADGANEDDRVNVPPPSLDSFVKRKLSQRVTNRKQTSLRHRQTMVPILLTTGVLFPVLAGLWCLTDVDSPFRKVGVWAPLVLLSVGLVTFLLGLLNVFQLREQLSDAKKW